MGAGADKAKGQSVVTGVVTSIGPAGTVMLTLPTLHGDRIQHRARLDASLLHPRGGAVWSPQPGDEVLVAFEQGDVSRPYVVGQLWTDASGPPENSGTGAVPPGGKKTSSGKTPGSFVPARRPPKA